MGGNRATIAPLAGAAIGGTAGGFFGGPAGVAIGAAAGGYLGGKLGDKKKDGKSSPTQTSGYTPEQTALLNFYRQQAQTGEVPDYLQSIMDAQVGEIPGLRRETADQYFQENIYNPAQRQLQESTLPALREAMGQNYWSSARRGAEQGAQQNFANTMLSERTKQLFNTEQAETQRAINQAQLNMAQRTQGLQAYQMTPQQMGYSLLSQQPINTIIPALNQNLLTSILGQEGLSGFAKSL